jgi:DnaK suppressor protein
MSIRRNNSESVRRQLCRPSRRGGRCRNSRRHLSHAELETFRRRLLEKRRTILGDVRLIHEETQASGPESATPGDLADIGGSLVNVETEAHLLDREVRLLTEIDEAIERIDQGNYGLCLATGRPISKKRLQALPWARYCAEHARDAESPKTAGSRPGAAVADVAQRSLPQVTAGTEGETGER